MKFVSTGATATAPQLAVARFVEHGGYERHLRQAVRRYQLNLERVLGWLHVLLPADVAVTDPQGGFVLWLEFKGLDCVALSARLLRQGGAGRVGRAVLRVRQISGLPAHQLHPS